MDWGEANYPSYRDDRIEVDEGSVAQFARSWPGRGDRSFDGSHKVRPKDALDVAIECSARGDGLWRTSAGEAYSPTDMSRGHLINVLTLVGKRYRWRTMNKAQRLFAKSALPENADKSAAMVAKAHYWVSVAQNAAAVYDRVTSIPIMAQMVRCLKLVHFYEYTWHDMREGLPRDDRGRPIDREGVMPLERTPLGGFRVRGMNFGQFVPFSDVPPPSPRTSSSADRSYLGGAYGPSEEGLRRIAKRVELSKKLFDELWA